MIAISSFLCSLILLLYIARVRKVEAISLYWVFVAFQCLYNLAPWITSYLNIPVLSLLSDHALIDLQLILSAISNICFGGVFWIFYRTTPLASSGNDPSFLRRRNFLILSFPIFLLTSALCVKYGWNQFATGATMSDEAGGMFAVAAYAKHLFVAIYVYYLYRFGLDRWAWLLFIENVIVLMIDGARTTFFPVAFLTLLIYSYNEINRRNKKVYVIAALGIFATIAARSLILSGDSTVLQKLIAPVAVEGTMGGYTSLQTLYAVQHHGHDGYTYGASYIVDPIALLLPKGELRNNNQSLVSWEQKLDLGMTDRFAPMGGFYYMAEAIAAFSYLGPPMITALFAGALVWMERVKNRHKLVYFAWVSSIGVLFVKSNFANVFKVFLVQLLMVMVLAGIRRYRVLMSVPAPRGTLSGSH
jgi:hypothetical protein